MTIPVSAKRMPIKVATLSYYPVTSKDTLVNAIALIIPKQTIPMIFSNIFAPTITSGMPF